MTLKKYWLDKIWETNWLKVDEPNGGFQIVKKEKKNTNNNPLPPFLVNKLFQSLNTSHLKEQRSYLYISKSFRLLYSYLKRKTDFWTVDY